MFGYEVTLLYALYSDFIQKYGDYYIEEGTESGFIGTLSELICEYLESCLKQMDGGAEDD